MPALAIRHPGKLHCAFRQQQGKRETSQQSSRLDWPVDGRAVRERAATMATSQTPTAGAGDDGVEIAQEDGANEKFENYAPDASSLW